MDPQSLIIFLSLRQPRRIRVIENILKGRKTVSNLYWGMRYGILDYLGIMKSIDKKHDKKSLFYLLKNGDIKTLDQRSFLLTPQGYQKALHLKKRWYVPNFLKYNLYYDLNRFKARFILAVQVASEYSYHNKNYYPVQIDYRDAQLVKNWFYRYKRHNLSNQCYLFLKQAFGHLDQLSPTLGWQAVNLLVGHAIPGQALFQQSRQLHQPITEMIFRQIDIMCALVKVISKQKCVFSPLLAGIRISPISDSAIRTFHLACNNYNFKQISRIQSIRLSTVKEHLLETAIFIDSQKFPYSMFISKNLMKFFNHLYNGNPDKWNYSKCQNINGRTLDFFYFRLFQILRSKQHE